MATSARSGRVNALHTDDGAKMRSIRTIATFEIVLCYLFRILTYIVRAAQHIRYLASRYRAVKTETWNERSTWQAIARVKSAS